MQCSAAAPGRGGGGGRQRPVVTSISESGRVASGPVVAGALSAGCWGFALDQLRELPCYGCLVVGDDHALAGEVNQQAAPHPRRWGSPEAGGGGLERGRLGGVEWSDGGVTLCLKVTEGRRAELPFWGQEAQTMPGLWGGGVVDAAALLPSLAPIPACACSCGGAVGAAMRGQVLPPGKRGGCLRWGGGHGDEGLQ
jgi:hypothetical protein